MCFGWFCKLKHNSTLGIFLRPLMLTYTLHVCNICYPFKNVCKFIPSIFSMTHILVESSWSFWIIKPLKKVKTNCLKSSYRRKKKDLFFIHAQLSEMKKCNGFSGWYLKQGNKYFTTIYEKNNILYKSYFINSNLIKNILISTKAQVQEFYFHNKI